MYLFNFSCDDEHCNRYANLSAVGGQAKRSGLVREFFERT